MVKANQLSADEYQYGRFTIERIPHAKRGDEDQWAVTDSSGHVYRTCRTARDAIDYAKNKTEEELATLR